MDALLQRYPAKSLAQEIALDQSGLSEKIATTPAAFESVEKDKLRANAAAAGMLPPAGPDGWTEPGSPPELASPTPQQDMPTTEGIAEAEMEKLDLSRPAPE